MQDASGADECVFDARGEWFRQDGVAIMVVQDHEVLTTVVRGDRKTSQRCKGKLGSQLLRLAKR